MVAYGPNRQEAELDAAAGAENFSLLHYSGEQIWISQEGAEGQTHLPGLNNMDKKEVRPDTILLLSSTHSCRDRICQYAHTIAKLLPEASLPVPGVLKVVLGAIKVIV